MRALRLFYLLATVIVLTGGMSVLAGETDGAAGEEGETPLFTNDDLAKFGPPTGPDKPVAEAIAANENIGDWSFVKGFIDDQYERLDAERQHAMEVAIAEEQRREPEWNGWSGRLLLAPWSYWGYHPDRPVPHDKLGIDKRGGHGEQGVPHQGSSRGGAPGGSGRYQGIRARSTAARSDARGGGGSRR